MKQQKLTIGIDDATRCPVMGSMWVAMVAVTPEQRRKFASLNIKDSKLLSREEIDHIVKMTLGKLEYVEGIKCTPRMIDEAVDGEDEEFKLNGLFSYSVLQLLNRIPKFWEHKIIIDNCERTKERFDQRLKIAIERHAAGLVGVDTSKWIVEHHADENYWACSLASIYAKHWSNLEFDELHATYGDFGSGNPGDRKTLEFIKNNPDNPHIRKSWVTYKRMVESGEIIPAKKVVFDGE